MLYRPLTLFVGAAALCNEMFWRMERAGVRVKWDLKVGKRPWVPTDIVPLLQVDTAQPKPQLGPGNGLPDLLVFVFPFVNVRGGESCWRTEGFDPYWVLMRIVPVHCFADCAQWKTPTTAELVSLVSQYHDNGIGAVFAQGKTGWNSDTCSVSYDSGREPHVRISSAAAGWRAYTLVGMAPNPPDNLLPQEL